MAKWMNHMVKRYLRKWDRELELITSECAVVQKRELKKIIALPTFQYLNGTIQISDFEKQQITNYSDYEDRIHELKDDPKVSCRYFAQSSGTTSGKKKLIPTPESFVKCNHLRGSWYLLHNMYYHNPRISVFNSKNLLIGGSVYERYSNYTIGDVSGIMLERIPPYMRPWYVPRISEAVMPDWEEKLEITAQRAAATDRISLLGGTPTWVLAVLHKCLTMRGATHLSDLWPGLQAYIHGGVNFDPYRLEFEKLLGSVKPRFIEVYNSTEGFFAFQDRPDEEGMFLMCRSGIYFEFIKLENLNNDNHDVISIDQVEMNQPYVMLITTQGGLLRYVQGDIIQFVSQHPYRIKVIGRVQEFINAFGEDLYRQEVELALTSVLRKHKASVIDYTIAPRYITIEAPGCHEWYVEFETLPDNLEFFAKELDNTLRYLNSNYDQKRAGDLSMTNLVVYTMPRGSFEKFIKKRGSINGQSKVPRLKNDRSVAGILQSILKNNILVF